MNKRKSFSPEFKREAVRLMETSQKLPADLARELGVRRNQLYKWKERLMKQEERAFRSDLMIGACTVMYSYGIIL